MSAHHAPAPDADADTPDDPDPHDIIPEGFHDAWPGSTIQAKLRAAEQAPSSTDPETLPRCPEDGCASTRLIPKSERYQSQQRKDGEWICEQCGAHVTEPRQSIKEERRERVAELLASDPIERHEQKPAFPDSHEKTTLWEVVGGE